MAVIVISPHLSISVERYCICLLLAARQQRQSNGPAQRQPCSVYSERASELCIDAVTSRLLRMLARRPRFIGV